MIAGFLPLAGYGQLVAGSDHADNYEEFSSLAGENGGSGFGAWSVVANENLFNAGASVGSLPTQNGRESIGSPEHVVVLYANYARVYVDLRRNFANGASMVPGDSFSWEGSFSWNIGNRGFILYGGADWTGELLQLNHGGTDALTYTAGESSGTVLENIYNQAFSVNISLLEPNLLQLQVEAASGNFLQSFEISQAPTTFKWYYSSELSVGGLWRGGIRLHREIRDLHQQLRNGS